MLLKEKMEKTKFSPSERVIVNFILGKGADIKDYSTKMIADETYTSPSTLIRIAKKLDFQGFNEFKEAYLKEVDYLYRHFTGIDSNFPFTNDDTIMQITSKITNLHQESIQDTYSLFEHDSLQKAVQILRRSKHVRIFAISNMNYVGEEFAFKLNRINKQASIVTLQGDILQSAAMIPENSCAVCLSYSGETVPLLNAVSILKQNNIPVIAVTSVGTNSLSAMADVTLNVSTRERLYSKIAGFSSLASFHLVLDVLYSCLFSLNYTTNMDYKLKIARMIETNRVIDNEIIVEIPKED